MTRAADAFGWIAGNLWLISIGLLKIEANRSSAFKFGGMRERHCGGENRGIVVWQGTDRKWSIWKFVNRLFRLVRIETNGVEELQFLSDVQDLVGGAFNASQELDALILFRKHMFMGIVWRGDDMNTGAPEFVQNCLWESWNENDKSPCAWFGISCTSDGSVRAIDLPGCNLDASRTTFTNGFWGLRGLENLQQFRLTGSMTGRINFTESICTLVSLQELDLSDGLLGGLLPDCLNQLGNLRHLHLDGNFFEGGIPRLDNLTKLQVFSISRNRLSGPIGSHLNDLVSLVDLDLSSNYFNGSIPSLTNLVNLKNLNLNNNLLTGFENPAFPGPQNLTHLRASGNQLQGTLPVGIVQMLQLEVINMSFNQFTGDIPEGIIRQVERSFWLDLSNNQLGGKLPGDSFLSIGGDLQEEVTTVSYLNLSSNFLTGSIPDIPIVNPFGENYSTRIFLDLSHNQLTGHIPLYMWNKSLGEAFTLISLEGNQLEGDIIDFLTGFKGVTARLANNHFTGDLARLELNGKSPKVLDLSDNWLTMNKTEDNPDPMGHLWEMLLQGATTTFLIAGNKLEGISLPTAHIDTDWKVVPIEVLDVSRNHLVGPIGDEVLSSMLSVLEVLNISNNNLMGAVHLNITPLDLEKVTLDVSRNNLDGKLPDIPVTSNLFDPRLFYVSCVLLCWRWRVYKKIYEQDAELIATLREKETTALMPLRELRRATDNFTESAQIGEGGFGTVYKGQLDDGTVVAVKRSKLKGTEEDRRQFLNEVRILSQVNHRHLVKLLGCCMENKEALLVFEFVPNGTLKEHLKGTRDSRLSWRQRLQIGLQTAGALNYLHSGASQPIIHRDVKSANILLTEKLNVKVADFGISKLSPVEKTFVSTVRVQGTFGYIDPEYYERSQLTPKSDVYSFGVVLLELISAQSVIDLERPDGDTSIVTFARSLEQKGALSSLVDPILRDSCDTETLESVSRMAALALRCLEPRSKERPNMKQVWDELQALWLRLDSDFIDDPESDRSSEDFSELLSNSFHYAENQYILVPIIALYTTSSLSFFLSMYM
ncbi:hypothetical protein R1flu_007445 [Riccia fluitans]|uniref:Protein kinase domain-containing protein n=1 Tax=Riccia fluitans TaxID=41844 RepID=A0ABD1YYY5_9MARC